MDRPTFPDPHIPLMFPDPPPGPRRSLRTKAVVAVLVLVAIPTSLSGYLMHRHAARAMERALVRDVEVLAGTLGHLVGSWSRAGDLSDPDAQRALDQLIRDERFAFLVVADAEGRMIGQRRANSPAWRAYQKHLARPGSRGDAPPPHTMKITDARGGPLVVRRQTIDAGATDAAGDSGGRAGSIEIGLRAPRRGRMLADLRRDTVLIVAGLCLLSIPLVVWWVNGWVRPLRRMLAATFRVGVGEPPQPLAIRRNDEIGLLAGSFHAMAANLSTIQRALIDANARLEREVADRTHRLQAANRTLQHEMEEKDQFLRAVGHDLGAPLRNIAGLTRTLMTRNRGRMSEEMIRKLDRIDANVHAQSELIDDLLELSRIKSCPGRKQPVNLEKLVRSLADQFSYDLERHRIRLTLRNPLPIVFAERNRMRQVFQNLLDNAIKHMGDAEVREIEIGWGWHERRRAFYVRDTGPGIEACDRESIFQIFRRARRASAGAAPAGRGVGLTVVRTILACYGGDIQVRSEPGRGAVFHFTLADEHLLDRRGDTSPEHPPLSAAS